MDGSSSEIESMTMASSELAAILTRNALPPDAPPWDSLVAAATNPMDRRAALATIIASADGQSNSTALLRILAGEQSAAMRELALELAVELPVLEPILVPWLRPLLRDRRLPRTVLIPAAAALLRTTGPDGEPAARVLRDFAVGYGRRRLLARQAALRRQFGNSPAFEQLCRQLHEAFPLGCPRCGVHRPPAAMVQHLWRRHRRILTRGRVRSLTSWLDDWAARAPRDSNPDDGLIRLWRWLHRQRLKSARAATSLEQIASGRDAMPCPHCRALVALPLDAFPKPDSVRPLEVSRHRVSGERIVIERSTQGINAEILTRGPNGGQTRITDPDGRWNASVAIRRLVAPWLLLAIALACLLPPPFALLGAALALGGAYLFRLLVLNRSAPDTADALIDAAWTQVVPALDARAASQAAPFPARLALVSIGHGSNHRRRNILNRAVENATTADWAPLRALQVCDRAAIDEDPVLALADALAPVFRCEQTPAAMERLLALTPWRHWTPKRRARLRALSAGQAFDAGLGVWELIELSQVVLGLDDLLKSRDLDGLARLRWIWSHRDDRPWQRCGPATTVFEQARYSTTEHEFADAADLLLCQPLSGAGADGQPTPVLLTGRGLLFRGALLSAPAPIEVHLRPAGRGYELHFGPTRFRYDDDPSALAHTLMAWSKYLFGELLPTTDAALGKPDGEKLERLLRTKTLQCPGCGGQLRGRRPT